MNIFKKKKKILSKTDYEFPSPIDCDYKRAAKRLSDDGHIKTKKKKQREKNMHLKKAKSFPISRWDCLQPFHN